MKQKKRRPYLEDDVLEVLEVLGVLLALFGALRPADVLLEGVAELRQPRLAGLRFGQQGAQVAALLLRRRQLLLEPLDDRRRRRRRRRRSRSRRRRRLCVGRDQRTINSTLFLSFVNDAFFGHSSLF